MYVIAQHTLLDPPTAFTRGQRLIDNVGAPDGTIVLQFYPHKDGAGVTCLWESDSVDDVQRYVDETLGDASRNLCFEVDATSAFARQPLGIAEQSAAVTQ